MGTDPSTVAAHEFASLMLENRQSSARAQLLLERKLESPAASLPKCMANDAELEAAYRLFENHRISAESLLQPHVERTIERAAAAETIFAISDTTDVVVGGECRREGLGPLMGNTQGFLAHLCIAVAADGQRTPLGTLALETWVRAERDKPRRNKRGHKPNTELESSRWGRVALAAATRVGSHANVIHLMDREGDFFGLLCLLVAAKQRFIIRVSQNRAVLDPEHDFLFDALTQAEAVVEREVPLSRRGRNRPPVVRKVHPPRRGRMAKLALAGKRITIKRPRHGSADLPESLILNYVHVWELDAPAGEPAVGWKLVTTESIDTPADLEAIVDGYRTRWVIEEFNKALKTGCGLEASQLESYEALRKLLAILLPVAWQLLSLRALDRNHPTTPAHSILTLTQLEALRAASKRYKLPDAPTVHDALMAIAGLGGHLRRNGPPGWIVLSRGLHDFLIHVQAWTAGKRSVPNASKSDQS
jgi:hypothetical protein